MEVRDGRAANSVKATSASQPYRAPRLKVTGPAVAVIHGWTGTESDYAYDLWEV
jgi:uncharacterized protein involved in type VI secretion and phage assembly